MIPGLLLASALGAAAPEAPPAAGRVAAPPPRVAEPCRSADVDEIIVCRQRGDKYRIDPSVLQAMRAREAVPAQPRPGFADMAATRGCIGAHACKGDTVALVSMALTAARAAALAIDGEDWRGPLRTRPDEYELYEEAKARRAREPSAKVGLGVGK